MWLKKSLVIAAYIAAAIAGLIVLLVMNDHGGLDLKTFIVIGGLAIWYSLSKQIAQAERTATERHAYLLAQVKGLQSWAEQTDANIEHRIESAKMLAELKRIL